MYYNSSTTEGHEAPARLPVDGINVIGRANIAYDMSDRHQSQGFQEFEVGSGIPRTKG